MIRTHPPWLGRADSPGASLVKKTQMTFFQLDAPVALARRVACLWYESGLGLLHALARRPDGRDLLLLRGQRAERLCDQVRVRRDHVLPPRRVHHVCRVTPAIRQSRTVQKFLAYIFSIA